MLRQLILSEKSYLNKSHHNLKSTRPSTAIIQTSDLNLPFPVTSVDPQNTFRAPVVLAKCEKTTRVFRSKQWQIDWEALQVRLFKSKLKSQRVPYCIP